MNNFISSSKMRSQFLDPDCSKKELMCDVLFPDGTVIKNAKVLLQNGAQILLVIWIHGIQFNDWMGQRLEALKFKIT
jgi:phosphoribosylpyrophosphate synthetase